MMFLDCPAYLDAEGGVRCGLPAEVRSRFTMRSSGGPLESAMIRCPSGHMFNAPIESLTLKSGEEHPPGTAGGASAKAPGSFTGTRMPVKPGSEGSRPNNAPAYYLGWPASLWISVMGPRRRRNAPRRVPRLASCMGHSGARASEILRGCARARPIIGAAGLTLSRAGRGG